MDLFDQTTPKPEETTVPIILCAHVPHEGITVEQAAGKAKCWIVRKFGANIVTTEFWVTAGRVDKGRVIGRNKRPHKFGALRQVDRADLFATRKDADKCRDQLQRELPVPEWAKTPLGRGIHFEEPKL